MLFTDWVCYSSAPSSVKWDEIELFWGSICKVSNYCQTLSRCSAILSFMFLSPWKTKNKGTGETWLGVGRQCSSLECGLLDRQGICGWLCLEVAKTLAERELKKDLKANFILKYLFILPQSGLASLSFWLIYFLFLKWALINSFPLSWWRLGEFIADWTGTLNAECICRDCKFNCEIWGRVNREKAFYNYMLIVCLFLKNWVSCGQGLSLSFLHFQGLGHSRCSLGACYGLNCLSPPSPVSYVEALTPSISGCDCIWR